MEYELTDQEVREDQADCQRQAIGTPKGGLCDCCELRVATHTVFAWGYMETNCCDQCHGGM